MIKKFWVVRSRERLFWGLGFTASGLMLVYTALTLSVLPDGVPWRAFLFDAGKPGVSRYFLLLLPLVSLAVGGLLLWDARRKGLPLLAYGKGIAPEQMQKRRETGQEANAIFAFLLALFFFFWQLDRLNFAKTLPGFSPFVPLVLLAGAVIFAGVARFKLCRI